MEENLVIVESPAKAKTIEKFLGKNFTVKSSYGHIRDLEKKDFGVDLQNNYEPQYIVSPEKKKVVSELKKSAKQAQTVWLASDEDREGEAIAWHLAEVLKLKEANTKRIVFHEITKDAIDHAVKNPRNINKDLVDAQQARRILDRLVGFIISPVLWKKVKSNLSAGRVQSVAVRLLVEREREIMAFEPESSFKTVATFSVKDDKGNTNELSATLNKRFDTKDEAIEFLKKCIPAEFKIADITTKPAKRTPAPPFTTSTLQQEASRKLNFPVSLTMSIAQRLYEAGLITYMRTDSVNLSGQAIKNISSVITGQYGKKYLKPRHYKTKSKGAQEAHEAIRPTYFNNENIQGSAQERQLYNLIWKRTVASQMSDAALEKTAVTIDISTRDEKFMAKGEVIKFDGFLRVYSESTDDEKAEGSSNKILPPLSKNDELATQNITATQRFTYPAPRYTEASLVKKLEELGIGRPSTYAPTISTIQRREYVVKETRPGTKRKYDVVTLKGKGITEAKKSEITGAEKNKLFPTDIGMVVTDFLVDNFKSIFNYDFTARVEKQFDEIANGKIVWNKMIDDFYQWFHKKVEDTLEHADRNTGERILGEDPETGKSVSVRIGRYGPIAQIGQNKDGDKPKYASLKKGQHLETITLEEALKLIEESTKGRHLGDDPKTGKPVIVRIGRYGPVAQIGSADDKEKPQYASLKKSQSMESITLDEALELFKLPRKLGAYEDKEVSVGIGRFGPFIRHGQTFVSLKKTDDPYSIEYDRAVELIEEKKKQLAARLIKTFPENEDIKIILDRWKKPCVYYKKKYYRIPKDMEPKEMTLEDCKKLAGAEDNDEKGKKKSSKTTKKTATRKKTSAKKKSSAKKAKSTTKTTKK